MPPFVNPLFLLGACAIAVPIVLHLIMRQKPKLFEFPALRFVQRRHDRNQRRLRLRHLLLLLLRAAAIAILALALARPSIKFSHRFGSQEAPVAAALIFDEAPHMQYRRDKKTRLEAAQEIGQWLLQQLPPASQIAVCDSSMTPQSFDPDRGWSKRRIGNLEIATNPRPLTRIVGEAARVLEKSNLQEKEIYVFTDLSRCVAVGRRDVSSGPIAGNQRRVRLSDRRRRDRSKQFRPGRSGSISSNRRRRRASRYSDGNLLRRGPGAAGRGSQRRGRRAVGRTGPAFDRGENGIAFWTAGQPRQAEKAASPRRVAIAHLSLGLAQAGHAAGAGADLGAGPACSGRCALFHRRGPPPLAGADRRAAAG